MEKLWKEPNPYFQQSNLEYDNAVIVKTNHSQTFRKDSANDLSNRFLIKNNRRSECSKESDQTEDNTIQ